MGFSVYCCWCHIDEQIHAKTRAPLTHNEQYSTYTHTLPRIFTKLSNIHKNIACSLSVVLDVLRLLHTQTHTSLHSHVPIFFVSKMYMFFVVLLLLLMLITRYGCFCCCCCFLFSFRLQQSCALSKYRVFVCMCAHAKACIVPYARLYYFCIYEILNNLFHFSFFVFFISFDVRVPFAYSNSRNFDWGILCLSCCCCCRFVCRTCEYMCTSTWSGRKRIYTNFFCRRRCCCFFLSILIHCPTINKRWRCERIVLYDDWFVDIR